MVAGCAALSLLLALCLGLAGCRPRPPAAPPEPFGPIRPIRDIQQNAAQLMGQVVRLRGKLTQVRNLNPGQPFPWDVVYTVDDGTGSLPVHWFTQEKAPKAPKPPVLPNGEMIVTGRLKRDLELENKSYPLLIHEQAELHNQEHPMLPAAPTSTGG